MAQQKQAASGQGRQKSSASNGGGGNRRAPSKASAANTILAYVHLALGGAFIASFFEIDNILQGILGGITRMLNFSDAWVAQADSYIIATFFFVGVFAWLYVYTNITKRS